MKWNDSYIFRKLEEETWKHRLRETIEGYAVNETIHIFPAELAGTPGKKNSTVLYLDNHEAFGDGSHPTTSLCLICLEQVLNSITPETRETIKLLDIGTGTGVLAILGAKMGLKKINAVDIEAASIESAKYNGVINGYTGINFTQSDIASLPSSRKYDIITANLITEVFTQNMEKISSLLKKDGTLIASGINNTNREKAEEAFRSQGLIISKHHCRNSWNCYELSLSQETLFQ
ncbi:MAG: methyltransferase domain-containing protein [bacterium]|nr:methyltransferase domain-containing protein [bacterium]